MQTDRDRLVEIVDKAKEEYANDITDHTETDYIVECLLNNDAILPPCKVGDTIWVNDFMWGLIPCKVDEPYHYVCGYDGGGCTVSGYFADKDIGEWVFLAKEEAEKALKHFE